MSESILNEGSMLNKKTIPATSIAAAPAAAPAAAETEQQQPFFAKLLVSLLGLAIGILLVQAVTGIGGWLFGKVRAYFTGVPSEIRQIPALVDIKPEQVQAAAERANKFLSSTPTPASAIHL